jgi:hypothetical protein
MSWTKEAAINLTPQECNYLLNWLETATQNDPDDEEVKMINSIWRKLGGQGMAIDMGPAQ